MKEEIIKEGITEIKENIEVIKSSLKERMKLPILVTYCIVIVIYNWDILFYLFFQSGTAIDKISFIKENYINVKIFLQPLFIAIISTIIFPVLQIFINIILNYFKKYNILLIQASEINEVEHEKNLISIKTNNKKITDLQFEILQQQSIIKESEDRIRDLENSVRDLRHSDNEMSDNYFYLREVLLFLTEANYKGKDFLYLENFKDFYLEYNKLAKEDKIFIIEFLELVHDNPINSISKIKDLEYYDSVDYNSLYKFLSTKKIFHTDKNSIKLSNIGNETLKILNAIDRNLDDRY